MGGVGGEDLRGVAAEICARIFFGVVGMGEFVVFAGGFEKNGGWMWLFDGEFVVECVVDVVFWRTLFRGRKIRHDLWIYFLTNLLFW